MTFWIEPEHSSGVFDLQWRAAKAFTPKGFIPDPAAPIFLEKLGFPVKKFLSLDHRQQQQMISSCWLDQRCLEFFRLHPEGLVIEIGAGYSSRFHRLSAALDWPRFKWCVLDQASIIDSLGGLLPAIDQFCLVAIDEFAGWIKDLPQATAIALLVEQKTLHLDDCAIEEIYQNIVAQLGFDLPPDVKRFNPVKKSVQEFFQRLLQILFFKSFANSHPKFVVLR